MLEGALDRSIFIAMSERSYYVYILASEGHSVLYVGVTNDLIRRLHEHRLKEKDGFTARYNVSTLVYFEEAGDIDVAIQREKQIKGLLRRKKEVLIEKMNPFWNDLRKDILPMDE